MNQPLHSLSTGKEGARRRDATAMSELQGAYHRVFFGLGATQQDQSTVLADLSAYTGYFFSQDAEATGEALREANAMRRVLARIIRLGLGAEGDLSALYRAAVAETLATREEGRSL
ncbi:hypothetical protein [Hoeflea prorocentri]|uniref:Uncharacterized protein n=1 Tax=Hoeflea prorocentri TaxID=1922333 RepID=A0A9X3UGL7_9HYPH|nr:hypothetical protein [Hoeflea prorocentri]MCY6380988.1 hypothetical protein [Hoeflea prorocentri]MDA5398788.1 hypothetical protein [Hoeflea prorocentri]